MLDGDCAELWCSQRLERSVERSDGCSGCSDDDGFVGGLRVVCWRVIERRGGENVPLCERRMRRERDGRETQDVL